MNWEQLFKAQAELDNHIIEEKGLQGQDLLDKKILALQVELGELANEWRGFKFWKVAPKPNVEEEVKCTYCDGTGDLNHDAIQEDAENDRKKHEYIDCDECDCSGVSGVRNPLLEEYVDCLHFILSIGNDLEVQKVIEIDITDIRTTVDINGGILSGFKILYGLSSLDWLDEYDWLELAEYFNGLGAMLGFTEEQIEEAYFSKNKINHERQENAY
ncbi:hypothetical protein Pryu01_03039 [Paraliobacillus ryukyuensis]|uniref:Dimeric dUTPase (All-alpha-NTP-PPase superfamily) n=1 Tax=Paraliobacillus ryukyuensis TaxID=200904 RepID=A0A366DQB6_9BACI|nr:dUTP diphosphatase [Paraliobacillus ryukyuensis]RBO92270.1 dimeric dUTPase (all-alpha-NTP-PPase superfamily) [Paraliobacillus ryukyuensis]